MNASFAVQLPGDTGAVIVSVSSSEVDTPTARRILCSHYNSFNKAIELVVMGDFDCLAEKKQDCCHGVLNGEGLTDCLPETFESFEEYEGTITSFPYDNNYVFKDKSWYELSFVTDDEIKYTKLKKPRKRRRNAKTK